MRKCTGVNYSDKYRDIKLRYDKGNGSYRNGIKKEPIESTYEIPSLVCGSLSD